MTGHNKQSIGNFHANNYYIITHSQCTKQVRQQDAYPTKAGGAVKTMYNTVAFFSMAKFPSLIVCLHLAYSKLLQELSYRKHNTSRGSIVTP